jgi:hypothetical protein
MPALRQMEVGVQLSELRRRLLAETFQSLNPNQTTSSTPFYNYQLDRTQREQWNTIEWPHLTIYKDVPMSAGQRYYDYPPQLPLDSIFRIWWPQGVNWVPLDYGINPQTYSTMGGENVQAWPPRRWDNHALYNETTGQTQPAAQFEVWPTPPTGQPYSLRIEGNAPLNPLIEDTDICVIDATLIVLFAASEILSNQKSEGAALKLQKANQYRRMLIARLGAQQRNMKSLSKDGGHMGPLADGRRLTPYLDFIPAYNQIGG